MGTHPRLRSLRTRWADSVSRDCPLCDYPRPQFVRPGWLCLNGTWSFGIFPESETPKHLGDTILVPFSPETLLSGAIRGPKAGEKAWYSRRFRLPEGFLRDRLLLHFGAVDQCCEVFVNGHSVGGHEGGYTPFTFDITAETDLGGDNTLSVAVSDLGGAGDFAYGKQAELPTGGSHTAQSGIWQTVWLESVPERYLSAVRITPHFEEKKVTLQLPDHCEGDAFAVFAAGKRVLAGRFDETGHAAFTLEHCIAWTPEKPFLYDLLLRRGRDVVKCYFAMRSLRAEGGKLYLNGSPVFLTGLLDSGLWPESLYTAPTDEAMISDIETAKGMGFNVLRKHAKVEPLRWYYHCDRLGMLVWQDLPSGGAPYPLFWTQLLPLLGVRISDEKHFARLGRKSEAARRCFLREAEDIAAMLYNSPSLVCWTLFHEGRGQFAANALTERFRTWDPTRLIDPASGWYDQRGGDFCSRHSYLLRPKLPKDSRVPALTGFGGYHLTLSGHAVTRQGVGYRKINSPAELTAALEALYREQILPLKDGGLQACIYTQLCDTEQETDGLLTWDRAVLKADAARILALNELLKAEPDTERSIL